MTDPKPKPQPEVQTSGRKGVVLGQGKAPTVPPRPLRRRRSPRTARLLVRSIRFILREK